MNLDYKKYKKNSKNYYTSKALTFRDHIKEWSIAIEKFKKIHNGKIYYISLNFQKYIDYYCLDRSSYIDKTTFKDGVIHKRDLLDSLNYQIELINWWYTTMLKALFSRNYQEFYEYQPIGIGYIDKPAFKNHSDDMQYLPVNTVFPHAHFVLSIPEKTSPELYNIPVHKRFKEMIDNGKLRSLWERVWEKLGYSHQFNEKMFHIKEVYDVYGALSYGGKTAKFDTFFDNNLDFQDYEINLPCKTPKKFLH